jgi:predicted PurR-regulated permease PerM
MDWSAKVLNSIWETIKPIVYGAALAYLTNFILVKVLSIEYNILSKSKKMSSFCDKHSTLIRNVAIFISELIVLGFLVIICVAIAPSLIENIETIISNLPETLSKTYDFIRDTTHNNDVLNNAFGDRLDTFEYDFEKWVLDACNFDSNTVVNTAVDVVSTTIGSIIDAIVAFVISVMLLGSKDKMISDGSKLIKALFGPKFSPYVFNELAIAHNKFKGFFTGKLLDSTIVGVITLIIALAMGIDYAVLIALIIGVTNVVPIIGPLIGGIPSVIIVCGQSPLLGVYWGIAVIVIQQLDGNIIGPKCIGSSTNINSFWILVSLIIFGAMFGFVGMIIGVPLFTVIYDIVSKLVNHKLKKDNTIKMSTDNIIENCDESLE